MKPARFEYFDPRSLNDALGLLARYGDDAKLLAGGQSLVPLLNLRLARPALLVDINPLENELGKVCLEDGLLRIGALTRQREAERHPLMRELCPLLVRALRNVGHPTIRNRGTIGGSVAHADPSAEIPCALLALDGQVEARSQQSRRLIPAAEFFLGPFTTALRFDEVVTAVLLPRPPYGERVSFQEVARRHGDFAIVAVAAALIADDKGQVNQARLALAGAAPAPVRLTAVEDFLLGERLDAQRIAAAARLAAQAADPTSDIHASAEDRRHLTSTMVSRALRQILAVEETPA
jgi:CO/xanthine dehydrogenase FAD-binding subunit